MFQISFEDHMNEDEWISAQADENRYRRPILGLDRCTEIFARETADIPAGMFTRLRFLLLAPIG